MPRKVYPLTPQLSPTSRLTPPLYRTQVSNQVAYKRLRGRRFGNPKTEAERKETHFARFSSRRLPPRGSGLTQRG